MIRIEIKKKSVWEREREREQWTNRILVQETILRAISLKSFLTLLSYTCVLGGSIHW